MTSPDPSNIEQLTCHYAEAQQVLFAVEHPTLRQILEVMRSRDRLQTALADNPAIDSDELEKIVELDLTLKHHFATVEGDDDAFQQARLSFQPPDSAWWWSLNLKPKPVPKPKLADQFDWVWNLGTVACLVVSTAFMTQTAKAFSFKGFDVFGIASTIAQGTGLVLVAGGALTDRGHKIVGKILHDLRIPASLHAEVTFGASLVVLGSAYSIHQNLPMVGELYLRQAKAYEENNQFSQALKSYDRALNFDPDSEKILISNGFLYEKIGELDRAIELYQKGARLAVPEFLNAQARAMLFRELKKNNWQPGADEKVLNEVEDLLDRARKQLRNNQDKIASSRIRNKRLFADVQLNSLMIQTMRLKSKTDVAQFPESILDISYHYPSDQEANQQDLTWASTLGKDRIECLLSTYHFLFDLPESSNTQIWSFQEELARYTYQCNFFYLDPRFSGTPDAQFLTYLESLVSPNTGKLDPKHIETKLFIHGITSHYGELKNELKKISDKKTSQLVRPVKTLETWMALKKKTIDLIREYKDFSRPEDAKQDLIWRVVIDSQGQVIAYFLYDRYSLDNYDLDPIFGSKNDRNKIIQRTLQDLKDDKLVEFADFKIVVSPSGQVRHILPWAMAYPSFYQFSCQSDSEACLSYIPSKEVQAAFQPYEPNFSNSGEVAALRSMLYSTLELLGWNSNGSLYYEKPLHYRLKVSADGQILEYKVQDEITTQKLGQEFPRTGLEKNRFKNLQRLPITYFNIKFRGSGAYQLTHESDPQE